MFAGRGHYPDTLLRQHAYADQERALGDERFQRFRLSVAPLTGQEDVADPDPRFQGRARKAPALRIRNPTLWPFSLYFTLLLYDALPFAMTTSGTRSAKA